jgi:hypothetical protein
MQNEPNRYPKLELEGYGDMDSAYEEGCEWDDDDLSIDFTSIDYLTAVDVLTRIMNEEIGLSNEEGYPYYINEKAVVS